MSAPTVLRDVVPTSRWLAAAPAGLLLVIAGCDAVLRGRTEGTLVTGALDEPAHLATAALVLLACVSLPHLAARWREALAVLAGAVLIDLDHLALYAGVPHVDAGGRPVTHSLATVVVLVLLARLLPAGRRRWALAAALGVLLHFVRDVATGPGLALWWPVGDVVLLPYRTYAAVVVVLAVLATRRLRGAHRRGGHWPP